RFDPRADKDRHQSQSGIAARLEGGLQKADSLDEDRILRRFVYSVRCAIRTYFFQTAHNGRPKPLISVQIERRRLPQLPLSCQLYACFAYSLGRARVHVRSVKVARCGVRWSEWPQDLRTESLGLAKAQQVKNAVIVPVGAKGGFVPKLMPKGAPRYVL